MLGQCYQAYKLSQKLEKMLEGVDYVSESDSAWTGFASWEPVKKINAKEIKRVLKLRDKIDGEVAYYKLEESKNVYKFLRNQIEAYEDEWSYNDPVAAAKLKKVIHFISKKFGKNVRFAMHGEGNEWSSFVGDRIIIMIMDDGCVLGLKAYTVWT